jgi:hypothetical protein
MPVRNIWSLEPGECIVAEELLEKLRCEVFFPVHDIGVDLLAVKGAKHVGIQLKESRYFFRRGGHSWHQVKRAKFLKGIVDFYVFLTYLPVLGEHKVSRFDNKFLIVPSSELEKRMAVKNAGKRQIYSFYFHFEGAKVWDERVTVKAGNPLTDYSEFSDAWNLIGKALG